MAGAKRKSKIIRTTRTKKAAINIAGHAVLDGFERVRIVKDGQNYNIWAIVPGGKG